MNSIVPTSPIDENHRWWMIVSRLLERFAASSSFHNASKVVQRYPLFNQFLIDTVSILVWYYFDNLLLLRRVSAKMDTITTSEACRGSLCLPSSSSSCISLRCGHCHLSRVSLLHFVSRFSFLHLCPRCLVRFRSIPFSLSFEHCSFSSGLATSYPCSLLAALSCGADSRRGSE
jgi:hypothetical protein